MSVNQKESVYVSEALKGIVDESQFYDSSYNKKNITTLYFSNEKDPVDINLETLDINNIDNVLKIVFECNSYLAGQLTDESFEKIDMSFMGYVSSRKIDSLKSTSVSFSSVDLCIVTLTFGFIDPI